MGVKMRLFWSSAAQLTDAILTVSCFFAVAQFILLRRNFRKLCRAKGCSLAAHCFHFSSSYITQENKGKYPLSGTHSHVSHECSCS